MYTRNFITKEELIRDLGISRSTFYRRIRALNLPRSGQLLSLKEVHQYYEAFGLLPKDNATLLELGSHSDL